MLRTEIFPLPFQTLQKFVDTNILSRRMVGSLYPVQIVLYGMLMLVMKFAKQKDLLRLWIPFLINEKEKNTKQE